LLRGFQGGFAELPIRLNKRGTRRKKSWEK